MKEENKLAACLNCGRPLAISDNFCPHCGQVNTQHRFKLSTLFHDFFSNYFSFDSKLSRSTVPFLVKPGFLTNRYNEGKRVSYVHPLRLYLIITFIFFFLLSVLIDSVVVEHKLSLMSVVELDADDLPQAALQSADTTGLDADQRAKLKELETKTQVKADSALKNVKLSTEKRFLLLMRNDSLTDEQVMAQLNMKHEGSLNKVMIHQARKILKKDIDVFLPFLIKNLSIMMFLLLPVFAFFLYVLFRRKHKFYISHAIHALHLHSFSFFILILVVIVELSTSTGWLPWIAFGIITLYAFLSIKRVYGQSWLRTFIKFNVLGYFYLIALLLAVTIEVFISFMLF